MRTCHRTFGLVVLSTSRFSGPFFSFGAKLGVPLSQAFHAETDLNSPPLAYALGEARRSLPFRTRSEFHLFGHLRLEADGL